MSGILTFCRKALNRAVRDEIEAFSGVMPDRENAEKTAAKLAKSALRRPHRADASPVPLPISLPITSLDEYDAATVRAQALMRARMGSSEKAEVEEIMDAIALWDQRHDNATCWE